MGPGRAFRLGAPAEAESTYTPVVKRWETIEGRTVLFEQIEWSACEALVADWSSPAAVDRSWR